jgi:hypothetical protein
MYGSQHDLQAVNEERTSEETTEHEAFGNSLERFAPN